MNFFKHIHNHRRKIAWSAPIIFLVLINSADTLGAGNVFLFERPTQTFLTVGDTTEVALSMRTKAPVNAVGGTVAFSNTVVRVVSLSRITSAIDLWTEEPLYAEADRTLHFSGGMLGTKATVPTSGTVFVMTLVGETPGVSTLSLTEGQMLAANGEGTNILAGGNTVRIHVRAKGAPSPDVNGDGVLSVADANMLYVKTFRAYDARYDLNLDEKVSWGDVRYLVRLF